MKLIYSIILITSLLSCDKVEKKINIQLFALVYQKVSYKYKESRFTYYNGVYLFKAKSNYNLKINGDSTIFYLNYDTKLFLNKLFFDDSLKNDKIYYYSFISKSDSNSYLKNIFFKGIDNINNLETPFFFYNNKEVVNIKKSNNFKIINSQTSKVEDFVKIVKKEQELDRLNDPF